MELLDRRLQTIIRIGDNIRGLLYDKAEHLETIRLTSDGRQKRTDEIHVRSERLHKLCNALPALADEELEVALIELVGTDT